MRILSTRDSYDTIVICGIFSPVFIAQLLQFFLPLIPINHFLPVMILTRNTYSIFIEGDTRSSIRHDTFFTKSHFSFSPFSLIYFTTSSIYLLCNFCTVIKAFSSFSTYLFLFANASFIKFINCSAYLSLLTTTH